MLFYMLLKCEPHLGIFECCTGQLYKTGRTALLQQASLCTLRVLHSITVHMTLYLNFESVACRVYI